MRAASVIVSRLGQPSPGLKLYSKVEGSSMAKPKTSPGGHGSRSNWVSHNADCSCIGDLCNGVSFQKQATSRIDGQTGRSRGAQHFDRLHSDHGNVEAH